MDGLLVRSSAVRNEAAFADLTLLPHPMTGTSQRLRELTLTSDHKIAGDLTARVEYRRDLADTAFFARAGSLLKKKSQSTLAVGLTYAFGGKL